LSFSTLSSGFRCTAPGLFVVVVIPCSAMANRAASV
jgi:hypothetical protein